jgi:DNA-binding GntR family transcriptional regulator
MVAYEYIKGLWIKDQIGYDLSENSIAKELGISRTPVREAMKMLEADGLVKIYPHKGLVAVKLDVKDISDLTEIREGLEGIAARVACEKADKEEIRKLLKELKNLGPIGDDEEKRSHSIVMGDRIHKHILESTKNQRLIKIVDNMSLQIRKIWALSKSEENRAEKTLQQHIDIATAILEGDKDGAEKAMRDHVVDVSYDAINGLYRLSRNS